MSGLRLLSNDKDYKWQAIHEKSTVALQKRIGPLSLAHSQYHRLVSSGTLSGRFYVKYYRLILPFVSELAILYLHEPNTSPQFSSPFGEKDQV